MQTRSQLSICRPGRSVWSPSHESSHQAARRTASLDRAHEKSQPGNSHFRYGEAFGVLRAIRITPEGADLLSIAARDAGRAEHNIIAAVSQCSFLFSLFLPTFEEPDEKVILGFAEGTNA